MSVRTSQPPAKRILRAVRVQQRLSLAGNTKASQRVGTSRHVHNAGSGARTLTNLDHERSVCRELNCAQLKSILVMVAPG
jgi:hypothetical protein